jgi:DNA replication protein DnaC
MNRQQKFEGELEYLKLSYIRENYDSMVAEAAKKQIAHMDFLASVIASETNARQERAAQRRIQQARFPVVKTIEEFQWDHPKKINRDLVRHLFNLKFIEQHANIIFLGGTGLGKSHLATALAYHACSQGRSVRFDTAINVINRLDAAQKTGNLGQVMRSYTSPELLCLDELGYLPINQRGADLLFQVISSRYERGSMIITSNRQFNKWHLIFDNDTTITSAILDRVLHHSEVVLIEGTSFRMKQNQAKIN